MLGSGCAYRENQFVYGDFICQMDASKTVLNIAGLSEEGKLKEVIIIPKEINGLPVNGLVDYAYILSTGKLESEALIRIYMLSTKYIARNFFAGVPQLEKVFLIGDIKDGWQQTEIPQGEEDTPAIIMKYEDDQYLYLYETPRSYFVSRNVYDKFREIGSIAKICIANITYFYNFEGSSNCGIYWIDDYNYGAKIEYIPDEPVREGYDFGGWYKEAECVTPWDFESDALPQEQRTEDGLLIYQETKLFAKWIKN